MLYQIGTLTLDTAPFNVDDVDRTASADFAVKPVIGAGPRREFMGEGDDEIALSGQLLPLIVGGLTELETLHGFRRSGRQLPVMRGDGKMMGWFAITRIQEKHADLDRTGVGFAITHTITLIKVGPERASAEILPALLSLFGVLGR